MYVQVNSEGLRYSTGISSKERVIDLSINLQLHDTAGLDLARPYSSDHAAVPPYQGCRENQKETTPGQSVSK